MILRRSARPHEDGDDDIGDSRRPEWAGPDDDGEAGDPPLSPDALMVNRLRAALDRVEDGVVICDGYGETIFRNATAERNLGVSSRRRAGRARRRRGPADGPAG